MPRRAGGLARPRAAATLVAAALWLALQAQAHVGGDGFLGLDVDAAGVRGQWILPRAAGVGTAALGGPARPPSAEPATRPGDQVFDSVLGLLSVMRDGRDCTLESASVRTHEDPNYLVLHFAFRCEALGAGEFALRALGLADGPWQEQHVVRLREGPRTDLGLLDAAHPELRFTLASAARGPLFARCMRDGLFHVLQGSDHLLFLLTLLLPAVLRHETGHWEPRARLGGVLADTLRIVTAFTVAHSLTLAFAVLGWIRLPSRLVETTIAASVLWAALDNLRPPSLHRWQAAFGFGLVHGLAFANALTELGLTGPPLAIGLIGFNAGIEAGQAALVVAWIPLAFALRGTRFYARVLLKAGSMLASVWAGIWMVERIFMVQLLPPALP